MIIGINGYIGSGKDTVGKIIQYITWCNSVNSSDLPAFDEYFELGYEQHTWEIKKFAAKLKKIASLLTGIPVEKFEDQEFKKTYLGPEWDYWYDPIKDGHQKRKMTVRELLQKLGTEAIRDGLHTNAWVNALFADYTSHPDLTFEQYPNWIITDCRFPNEAQAIKDRGGIVVRVDREAANVGSKHPSEISLDGWEFDYRIDNNSSIEDLLVNVDDMLRTFKII